ncbi:MAG: hypothetical protein WC881_00880 [Elusimicrobiota bacterium]
MVFGLSAWLCPAARAVQLFIDQSFVVVNSNPPCSFNSVSHHFECPLGGSMLPQDGDISNQPNIEFERSSDALSPTRCSAFTSPALPLGTNSTNYCNNDVFLCAAIGYSNQDNTATGVALDEVNFEVFKFQDGSNPMDPASTPPIRTFFIDAPGYLPAASSGTVGPYCVLFDGSYNIQGEFGKTNGQFGFRVTAKTNQVGDSGNITIIAQRAYPAGATQDTTGAMVQQKPMTVDVTNVHLVRSSPTVVGQVTGVYAQPYNFTYRLSKDATMYLSINEAATPYSVIRNVVPGLPRAGEGIPQGTMLNGDSWNGRHNNGDLMPAGVYLATLQAFAQDQYGSDLSQPTTRQIAIDPLQITDIRVLPLLGGSTSLAVLSYVLTEPATVYVEIYPPDTQFCFNALNSVDDPAKDQAVAGSPKDLSPRAGDCAGASVTPLRRISEVKQSRVSVNTFWDGRDEGGNAVCQDGNYVFAMYAALPSQNGKVFGPTGERRIWTNTAKSGLLPVARGFVGINQVTPVPTNMGTNPSVTGLNPFVFRYSLGREGIASMKIYDNTGTNLIKTLIDNVVRPGQFANQERWEDATGNNGQWVTSGTYIVQLTAADPLCPMRVSTVSASFPVDLYRITDVQASPLLSGTSETVSLSYQLSQSMNVAWNIYPPGTVLLNTAATWPPCGALEPVAACAQIVDPLGAPVAPLVTFKGMRPGRLRITEYWDGRDGNGVFVPDGSYVFTLAAQSSSTPKYFASDKVFGTVTVARGAIIFTSFRVDPDVPALFNSSASITLHPYTITYALTRQSSTTIQILNNNITPQVVRTLIAGAVRQGGIQLEDVWDGRDDRGNFLPSGFYVVRALASDMASALSSGSTAQVTIAYDPLRIYDVAVSPLRSDSGGAQIYYQVSETMKVALKIFRPGTIFDGNGNPTPPESVSLVKRIVGVRPARSQVTETWDGTDLRMGITTDGNYKFKIVASTDMNAIDNMTGNVNNAAALS